MSKKGFTLIELLAVIAIIGIISGITIISLNKVFEKNRKNYYISQENMITLAGRNYAQDYRSSLPREVGQISKITLKDLKNKNYIDEVVDYKKKTCDKAKSYVLVRKISKTKYEYHVNLNCPDYETEKTYKTGSLDIDFTISGKEYHQQVNVTIKSSQAGIKVGSYNYIVYKDNKEIKNSGNIKSSGDIVTFTVDLDKLQTGKYTVKVIAYDNYTTISSNKTDEIKIDKTGPSCGSITGQSTTWTNQDRTISIACNDSISGCKETKYTKTFTETMKKGYITIEDKAGNKTDCNVNVYIDKIAPTCKSEEVSSNWKKAPITLKGECSDRGGSGCKKKEVETIISSYVNDSNYKFTTVSDKAGNKANCTANVKVDDCRSVTTTITYGACNAKCGGGKKEQTIVRTSTRGSNFTCSTSKRTVNCNTQSCCSSVYYKESPTCSLPCGGGRLKRYAYSSYNGSRCSNQDDWNGSACNTQSCAPTVDYSDSIANQNIGKWVCASSCNTNRTSCENWRALDASGNCIKSEDGNNYYGNVMGKVSATSVGNKVTFNWEIRQGKKTYINTTYYVDFVIKNSSNTTIRSVRLKEEREANWEGSSTHAGTIEHIFDTTGTYQIYIEGNSKNPSFNMYNFGTIVVK